MNRNFRFPAFSDESGVKLPSSREQENFLAQDLPAITKKEILNTTTHEEKTLDEPPITQATDVVWDQERKSQPTQSRTHFPSTAQSKPVFSGEKVSKNAATSLPHKRQFPLVKNEGGLGGKEENFSSQANEKSAKVLFTKEVRKRSYFVPKYIPASLIEEEKTPVVSQEELLKSLEKKNESYLLFSKNNLLAEENADGIIPETLKKAAEEAPKDLAEEGKKRGVLEKSLKGIFEEEQTPFYNRYFEE